MVDLTHIGITIGLLLLLGFIIGMLPARKTKK